MTFDDPLWSDPDFTLIRHESEIPWLILHLHKEYREYSLIPRPLRHRLADLLAAIEEEMLAYYRPAKINIASFGNHLPRQHWHIMARFREDSRFPEPMWAEPAREAHLDLPPFGPFARRLLERLGNA
ncbi:HIT family protein [Nitratifractor sp.]